MRGVVSGGMVLALQQLGLVHAFDAVYGSSAGAMNGAYMLAGQAPFGTTIYYEDINNRNFIDFGRPLHGRSIVDLDYLVDDVMIRRKRLDVEAVLRSPVPLHMLATHVSSGERHVFSSWKDRDDFMHGLRAGASMPVVAGPPYAYRDTHYWDAVMTEAIPVRTAEASGFSHIVALLTRPRGHGGPRISLVDRLVVLPRIRGVSPELADRYQARGRDTRSWCTAHGASRVRRGARRCFPSGRPPWSSGSWRNAATCSFRARLRERWPSSTRLDSRDRGWSRP